MSLMLFMSFMCRQWFFFFFQAEDGIRDYKVTGVQTCALPIYGYAAFCLTVDTASYSRRERDLARRFVKPWRTRAGGFEFQAGLSWDHVKRFKDTHAIPLVLKGIATAEDAALAVDHGVEGVYVSNHGGRQLDHGRGAVEVLPEVVRAAPRPGAAAGPPAGARRVPAPGGGGLRRGCGGPQSAGGPRGGRKPQAGRVCDPAPAVRGEPMNLVVRAAARRGAAVRAEAAG